MSLPMSIRIQKAFRTVSFVSFCDAPIAATGCGGSDGLFCAVAHPRTAMKLTMTIIRFIAVPTMPFREGFGPTVFYFLEKVYTLPVQNGSVGIRKFGWFFV
jgi:hypothetical protein